MRIINKKYLLIILLIGIILTGVVIFKPNEEPELYEVKLQDDNKKDLAIMVEQLDKSYKENNKIPYKGYTLNETMTKCIDNNGEVIDEEVTYENGTITISTDRTIYCYLYFDREDEIEDLSGQHHNGKNYAVEWTEDGITTSTKEEKGYVDCGLENYDFKDSITMITRLKFNDLDIHQYFFGNWEGAGGGFWIASPSIGLDQYINGDGYKQVVVKYNFSLNTYYTIVGVYNGNEISIYIDGQNIGSNQINGNIKPSIPPIFLGANPKLNGAPTDDSYTTFTDALIFDSALSDEEIKAYFSGTIDKEKIIDQYVNNNLDKKLLLYYKFN